MFVGAAVPDIEYAPDIASARRVGNKVDKPFVVVSNVVSHPATPRLQECTYCRNPLRPFALAIKTPSSFDLQNREVVVLRKFRCHVMQGILGYKENR